MPKPPGHSVLLVSRFPDDREMYAEFLQSRGYCTFQTDSAAEALRLATEVLPSVVITSIALGGADDGLALTARLKNSAPTRAIPVVVLSGYVFEADRSRAAKAGCDAFVMKPCLPDALETVIVSLSAPRRHKRRAAPSTSLAQHPR